ncbi:MAG: hypothetical protein IT495_21630 [Gammaproteobacteria bacterium]|nr:hypothetical protein [Gammaproteobacteria bacterium]
MYNRVDRPLAPIENECWLCPGVRGRAGGQRISGAGQLQSGFAEHSDFVHLRRAHPRISNATGSMVETLFRFSQ